MDTRWRNVLDKGLRDLAQEEPDAFQLERSLARIDNTHRRNPLMKTTRTTAIGFGVVAILFAALLLIPATYTVTVGHVATATVPNGGMEQLESLQTTLSDLPGVDRVGLMMSPDGVQVQVGSSETNSRVLKANVADALASVIPGFDANSLALEPVTVERGGNALAALTGGTISINTTGMSDDEIEAAIASALMGAGATSADVEVTTSADGGQREVRIEMEADVEPGEEVGEFTIDLQDDAMEGAEMQKDRHIEWVTEDE